METKNTFLNWVKTLSPIAAIVIYMFLCGICHLVAFWSTFNLDISQFIQIWDIPKSFVFPFFVSGGLIIVLIVISRFLLNRSEIDEKATESAKKMNGYWDVILTPNSIVFICLVLIFILYAILKATQMFFIASGLLTTIIFFIHIEHIDFIKSQIPDTLKRFIIINSFVLTPIVCFVTGKNQSLLIYQNERIRYMNIVTHQNIKNNISDSISIKFLGFLGDKVIGSSLNNEKIIVLNQSDMAGIVLTEKPMPINEPQLIKQEKEDTIVYKLIF